MKLVEELKLNIGYSEEDIFEAISKKTSIKKEEIEDFVIVRESIDARRKPDIFYTLNVAINIKEKEKFKAENLKDFTLDKSGLEYSKIEFKGLSPVVVGFGPAGMFAGLTLALKGLKPIIIEQGKEVDERKKDVEEFWAKGKLNVNSNVQFGEGGAGTFSDGKLNSNLDNLYCKKVINEFILNGAPKSIFYKSKPHIGSDNLPIIVKNIRNKIIANDGQILFNTQLIDLTIKDEKIKSILIENTISKEQKEIKTDAVILAVGHSAINTFELLKKKDFELKQKPFAMGVRIEQSQEQINLLQYGKLDNRLPNADYKLVEHLDNGRSIFTFCMCPGGEVVASSCEEGTIVTNGMSNYARDKENANSALLVNVTPEDFKSDDSLAGLYFQRKYEKLAFELGGANYNAPAERVDSFLGKKKSVLEEVKSSYRPSIKFTKIEKCLPDFLSQSLKAGLLKINKRIKDFARDDNILIAIETRSSCPVQITRNDSGHSTKIKGVFPAGEGAGYAGGIMSSAQDGIKTAEKVMNYLFS
jgi:uncharacterized FAD-dependent dehydrogenase